MGFFSNPLSYAGYPADPTTCQLTNSTVRAATSAEGAAATLKNVYISPATMSSVDTSVFAAPPPLGSTTPNTGAVTTLKITTSTAHGVLIGEGTSTVNSTAVGTTGQVLSGVTGADPVWTNLPSFNIVDVATSPQALAVGTTYVTDNGASLVTYTLPATAAQGQTISILGKSSGGWKITQGTGQTIHMNSTSTTTTTGSVASTAQYNCITLKCITANTDFVVSDSEGTLTFV